MRTIVCLTAALAILALPAAAVRAADAGGNTASVTVKSSLDGKSFLPHRIVWQAYPAIGPTRVEEVDFLIDGKLHWVEHHPTYVYGGLDGNGYLVTSWLTPGQHRFTIHVKTTDGHSGVDTVRARVVPTAKPPAPLLGTWRRTIDTSSAPAGGSAGNPTSTPTPSGNYTMTFERRWIQDQFPGSFVLPQSNTTGAGLYFLDDYSANATTIHVVGEVVYHPFSDTLPEGGSWCYFDGPPATYTWAVNGDTLTLKPVTALDPCGIRGYIWSGTWMRVS